MLNAISPRLRNSIVLGGVISGVCLSAIVLGIVPDHHQAGPAKRQRQYETLVTSSAMLLRCGDTSGLQAMLLSLIKNEDELLSVGIRRADGTLLIEAGEHSDHWQNVTDGIFDESQFSGPLLHQRGGTHSIEARFTPLSRQAFSEITNGSWIPLISFVTAISMLGWYLFPGTQLQMQQPGSGGLHSAINNLAGGLLVLDHKGRIVLCNHSLARSLGMDSASMVASDPAELPGLRDEFLSAGPVEYPWTRILERGQAVGSGVFQLRDTSGQQKRFRITAVPWINQTGAVCGVCCSFEGVTDFESQATAESADEIKSRFLVDMNHDIRTSINAILGFSEILRGDMVNDQQERVECLGAIHSSTQHLFQLITEMMDILQAETGRLEVTDERCSPHRLLLEVVESLQVRADAKQIRLDCNSPGGLPNVIQTDPLRLRLMITRLVANAIESTSEGGVTVSAQFVHGETALLQIDVRDTGAGLSTVVQQEMLGEITPGDDPFRRTFGGTDPVLMICRQYAEALGGGLSVQSEAGSGSTFTVTVETGPVDSAAAMSDIRDFSQSSGDMTTTPAVEKRLPLDELRVLIVDDGDSNREFLRLVLQRNNLVVATATDGREAVDMALSSEYDVVLMDMNMPGLDGYTASGLMRSYGLKMPIVALTGSTMQGDEERCLDAGCSHFLPKPIAIDKLLELLATLNDAAAISSEEADTLTVGKAVHGSAPGLSQTASSLITAVDTGPNHSEGSESGVMCDTATSPAVHSDDGSHEGPVTSTLPLDDPEFCEIVIGFAGRLFEQVEAIEAAWQRRDMEELTQLAHWLKGAAGTVGFGDFTEPAQALMESAGSRQMDSVERYVRDILSLTSRIQVPVKDP